MRTVSLYAPLLGLTLLAGGPTIEKPAAYAQSAYDYPWCAIYSGRRGAQSCYYATYEQCRATMSGIGGACVRSPYYRGATAPRRAH